MTEIICDACGKPIVGYDLDNRHWEHELDCPNYSLYDQDDPDEPVDCVCDLEYHAACCPLCNRGGMKVTIEIESSRFAPNSYWVPGAEYYAEKVIILVPDDFDLSDLSDEDLLEMADDENYPNIMYW